MRTRAKVDYPPARHPQHAGEDDMGRKVEDECKLFYLLIELDDRE